MSEWRKKEDVKALQYFKWLCDEMSIKFHCEIIVEGVWPSIKFLARLTVEGYGQVSEEADFKINWQNALAKKFINRLCDVNKINKSELPKFCSNLKNKNFD